MRFLAISALFTASVSGFSTNRNECPTLQDAADAFEDHFGTQVTGILLISKTLLSLQIPEGALDCLYGGENCPWEDLQDFGGWFQSATGITLPEPDQAGVNTWQKMWKLSKIMIIINFLAQKFS